MIGKHYFAQSGLSAEEKEQGNVALQRFIRGKIDEKIDDAGVDAAMAHIATRDANNNWELRDKFTDDQLVPSLPRPRNRPTPPVSRSSPRTSILRKK